MEIQLQNKNLQTAIKSVKKIFDKGPVADAQHLQHCLVASKDDGTVTLESASNGLYVNAQILADVVNPGRILVNRDYLSVKFPKPVVKFLHKEKSDRMFFSSGDLKGDVAVSESFDELEARRPLKIPELTIELPLATLQEGCRRVCFSPAGNEILNLRIVVEDGTLVMTTNDRYRAAAVRIPAPKHKGEGEIHIPAQFFTSVLGAMDDSTVRLGFDDRSIRIKAGGLDVCHPVLQDDIKKPRDIWEMAEEFAKEESLVSALFNAKEAKEAIASVASIPYEKDDFIMTVRMTPSDKGHFDVAMSSTLSQANYQFPVNEIEIKDKQEMAFNQRYLQEFFGLMGNADVEFIATARTGILKIDNEMVWLLPMTAKM